MTKKFHGLKSKEKGESGKNMKLFITYRIRLMCQHGDFFNRIFLCSKIKLHKLVHFIFTITKSLLHNYIFNREIYIV